MTVAETKISPAGATPQDAGGGVDGDPAQIARDSLDLAGVDAGPDHQADALGRVADGSCAAHGKLRPVESREHAVAGRLHEPCAMPVDRRCGLAVVLSDEVAPARRTEFGA
jgi:hypothetical protein